MMYEDVIRDFAERTRANQRAINHLLRDGCQVQEATQVVNSLLGLLVFPREKFICGIPEKSITELQDGGWPIPSVCNGFSQVTHLRQLVRCLRNAIAQAELSLDDIRGIAERFTDLLLEVDTQEAVEDQATS